MGLLRESDSQSSRNACRATISATLVSPLSFLGWHSRNGFQSALVLARTGMRSGSATERRNLRVSYPDLALLVDIAYGSRIGATGFGSAAAGFNLQSRRARSPMMSSAIMTADWAARFGDRWTVPVGKGVGRFSRSVRSSSTRACSSGMR